jgi:hypothetical protein
MFLINYQKKKKNENQKYKHIHTNEKVESFNKFTLLLIRYILYRIEKERKK